VAAVATVIARESLTADMDTSGRVIIVPLTRSIGMSRTNHHRHQKGNKGPGYDYSGKRYGNRHYGQCPSEGVKENTSRAERRIGKQQRRGEEDDDA
jgi:hypothetical protein